MNTCSWQNPDPCENLCEGNGLYCATHSRLARKIASNEILFSEKKALKMEVAKQKSLLHNKPINRVSDKRLKLNREYSKLAERFKIDNPNCRANIENTCTKITEDVHHSRGRGEYLLDVTTFIPVCRNCHIYLENHPLDALKRNLSFSRLQTIKN